MEIALNSFAFVLAATCVGVMGFAIQRGATCTVAAVDELITRRSARRLLSFFEASVWVVGGLLIAQWLQLLPKMPAGYVLNIWTLLGGLLLGLGAFVNGACVFGAVARFGSGQWAYLFTPLGFYAGCLSFDALFPASMRSHLPEGSPLLQAPGWVALLFLVFMAWRLGRPLWQRAPAGANLPGRLREALASRIWAPHAATTVIGITFLFVLLLIGATWTYTDVLAEAARGMAGNLAARGLLLLALLLGAAWGGHTAGRWRNTSITLQQVLRCFAGGLLMGWGSLLIPGGNDGLILVGMPLLWPYAWVAFLGMCLAIGAAQLALRPRAARIVHDRLPPLV